MKLSQVHVILVGDDSRGIVSSIAADWERAFPQIDLVCVADGQELAQWNSTLLPADHVALGMVSSEVSNIDKAFAGVAQMPLLQDTQWILLTDRDEHTDLATLTSAGHLAAVMRAPCTLGLFLGQAYQVMVAYFLQEGLNRESIIELIGPAPKRAVQGPLLQGLGADEYDMVRELLEGVEEVIGRRPRIRIPAGVDLTRQNTSIAAVHLVLEGQVSLRRETDRGELLLHHATSGLLIGLVSLTRNEKAFFTATTTTPAQVVRLTNEQLRMVIDEKPSVAGTLAVLAIQSLTRRLIRAEDLHMENAVLAEDLEEERAHLAETLEDLKNTRAELVERTRFAMLGELSAGIAHELNNPVTALVRAAEHLGEDLDALLETAPAMAAAHTAMRRARTQAVRSTAQERELVRQIYEVVGDRALARRLVQAGVEDPAEARKLTKRRGKELPAVELGARAGSSLRSVLSASERVIELTASLKGYARPDSEDLKAIDVREGLDDVLRLTNHRLRGIEVKRYYEDVPAVLAHPAKLQQVWTNLLVNAAEAIDDEREDAVARGELPARGESEPLIHVAAECFRDQVTVTITDNGPGIPAAVLERIYEPHFTTKAGRVRYGLGMGMAISRSIVEDVGGSITVESHPGRTRMIVALPAHTVAMPASATPTRTE